MSTATLRQKLLFDDSARRSFHLRIAVSCRDVARLHPPLARPLRAKMRSHALQSRGLPAA
jgi:hypothetical protein